MRGGRRALKGAAFILIAGAGCGNEANRGAASRTLFARAGCAACHGADGRGDGIVVRAGNVRGVDLSQPASFRYGRDPVSIDATIANGRSSERGYMPGHLYLTAAERRELVRYVVLLSSQPDTEP
jgi:mono/diheme cytochrome c family protein